MTTVPAPTPEPQPSLSAVKRLVGVVFSPKAAFEDIVRKPSWLLPAIILALLGLIVAVSLNQKMNWRDYISQQIEKNPRASMLSPEQKEKQIEMGAKIAPITTYVFSAPAPLAVIFVVALIMWGAYSVLAGVNPGYKTALGIVAHAFVPVILGNVLFLVVLFLKDPATLDLANPVATNVAAFLPEAAPKWLEKLGKNIDIFAFWIVILIAMGFAAANPKKLRGGTSYAIAFGVFAFYVLISVGITWVFS